MKDHCLIFQHRWSSLWDHPSHLPGTIFVWCWWIVGNTDWILIDCCWTTLVSCSNSCDLWLFPLMGHNHDRNLPHEVNSPQWAEPSLGRAGCSNPRKSASLNCRHWNSTPSSWVNWSTTSVVLTPHRNTPDPTPTKQRTRGTGGGATAHGGLAGGWRRETHQNEKQEERKKEVEYRKRTRRRRKERK